MYAVDIRNHGESPWSDEMDLEILSNDIGDFMDDHEISKAILVGHSMGGKTAVVFALRQVSAWTEVQIKASCIIVSYKACSLAGTTV